MNPTTARRPPGCCMRSFVNCSYTFAARNVLTKAHLQECFTASNSKTTPDIDVISAPECVSQSKDAEKCKKVKVTFLHLHVCCTQQTHQVVTNSEYGNKQIQQKLQSTFLQPTDNRDVQILEFWVHDQVCNN